MDPKQAYGIVFNAACRANLNMADNTLLRQANEIMEQCFQEQPVPQNGKTDDQT